MNIALMAHDNRKELMVQFCTAYCGILAKHTLCATARTGQQIADATGLTIHRFLSFAHGGGQQIAARIAYNEIDMVLCFGDPNQKTPDADITYISRLCDQNNVPLPATWPPPRCWCWVWTGATWTGVTSSIPRTSPLRLDNHRQIAYNKG